WATRGCASCWAASSTGRARGSRSRPTPVVPAARWTTSPRRCRCPCTPTGDRTARAGGRSGPVDRVRRRAARSADEVAAEQPVAGEGGGGLGRAEGARHGAARTRGRQGGDEGGRADGGGHGAAARGPGGGVGGEGAGGGGAEGEEVQLNNRRRA